MRLYKVLFFLVPVILLAACKSGRPDGVLSPDKMVPLLVDVHIVDGSISDVTPVPDTLFKHGIRRFDNLFKAHGVDTAQFRKSFAWYSNQPDQFYEIYSKVSDIIKAKSDSALKARAKTDSLERIKQNKLIAAKAKRFADSVKKVEKRKADSVAKANKGKTDSLRKKLKTDSAVKPKKPKTL